ncbi:hypothetical protein GCM10027347_31680 [Larkinella harenae]
MKLHRYLLIGWGLALCLTSCKKDPETVTPEPVVEQPDESGTATKVGQAQGAATRKTIGPEGGTISTPDGNVQLVLPAGAVSKATEISIQPITNENPHGLAQAYRFSPEGLKFNKPATLTFQYDPQTVSVPNAENFGIAYQRENAVWYDVAGASVNTSKHEISVPMEHFSDWTPYELAQFDFAVINPGGSLSKGFTVQCGESIDLYAGLLTYNSNYPKDAKEKPLKQTKGFGKNWQLIGEGKLVERPSNGATYTAPGKVPKQNPVLVTTELTFEGKKFKLILTQKIFIGLETYFDLSVHNIPQETTAFACARIAGKTYLTCGAGNNALSLQVNTDELAPGKYVFFSGNSKEGEKDKVVGVYGSADPNVAKRWLSYYHDSCTGKAMASPGSVQIKTVEIKNGIKYVEGTFVAQVYMTEGVCNKGWKLESMPITGSFRMEVLKP